MPKKPTYEWLEQKILELEKAEIKSKQTEEALRKSEAFLNQSQKMARIGSYVTDLKTGTWLISKEMYSLLGIDKTYPHTLEGFIAFVHPDSLEDFLAYHNKVESELLPFDYEYKIIRGNDKAVRWVHGLGSIEYDEQLNPVRRVGTIQDISEHKQAEKEIKQISTNLRAIFDSVPNVLVLINEQGQAEMVNNKGAAFSGREKENLVGLLGGEVFNCLNSFTEDGCGRNPECINCPVRTRVMSTFETGKAHTEEEGRMTFLRAGNKDTLDLLITTVPLNFGGAKKVLLSITDITERNQAREKLRFERDLVQHIMEISPAGIARLDNNGNIVYINQRAMEILGVGRDKAGTRTYDDSEWKITDFDGGDFPKEQLPFNIVKQSGKPTYGIRHAIEWPNGRRILLSINSSPLTNEEGNFNGVIATLDDISEKVKTEEKYEMLFNEMIDGFALHEIICNSQGRPVDYRFLDINPAFERITGLEQKILIGKTVLEVLPETETYWIEKYGEVALTGKPIFFENYSKEFERHFQVTAFRPAPNQFACIFSDITEHKKAEDALKKSELFLENMSDIAYRADNQGNLAWVNSAGEQITGLSREDLIGKPFPQLFIEADRPSLIDVYKRTLMGESLENTLTFTSGVACHFTSLPYRNADGDIVGTFGVARDITAQLDAQRELKTSEARLKKAQETARIGNWEYDIATGKVWGSEEAFRIYGIERTSEFLPLEEVESHILDVKRVNQSLVDLITKKKVYDIEFQINSKVREGLTIIHSMADLVFDTDGNPVKVHGVIQDITEQKRAEKERENLEKALRQAVKMEAVGRLAGGVAHDFNNMLSVIIGHAEMALQGVDPAQPLYANLEEIKDAGERSADLTRQLLAFARKQTVAPKVLDLNKTVRGMTRMLQRLIGEDIDLSLLPDEKLWLVKMDPSQIDQILANLCVNARDAITNVGKITIETGNAVFDESYCKDHVGFLPGEYVLLAVSDNGCGMDTETIGNIFEPFFTTKESGKGTGLGLATVYGVVKQNNGFINVYSEPGHGTTFRIYLPRHLTKTARLSEKMVNPPSGLGHETILLVEDEPAILRMTTVMLERLGYTVVAARTPGEAISLAHKYTGKIDLLVTDVVMPEMNGRDLAKNILSFYPNLKRLFMSGYTANVIAHHGVLDEGVNFIQKPFSGGNLGAKVREVLDKDKD